MPGKERYQDEHRIFLQGMMCKGILKEKDVYSLHNKALKICNIAIPETKDEKNSLLTKNIQIINMELRKVGLLIKKGQDEDSGKSFFLLVNTQSRMIGTNRELASSVQVIIAKIPKISQSQYYLSNHLISLNFALVTTVI